MFDEINSLTKIGLTIFVIGVCWTLIVHEWRIYKIQKRMDQFKELAPPSPQMLRQE